MPSSSTSSRGRPPCSASRTSARLAPGVAGDVRQRLLGDAVEHELLVGAERRQAGLHVRRRPSSSECSATRSPRTSSALARPRSSSASGRSRRAIRRTSSRLSRAVSCASITPGLAHGVDVARDAPELQDHAGEASARRRRGAPAPRAAARPPARRARGRRSSRRSASRRSSISLNARRARRPRSPRRRPQPQAGLERVDPAREARQLAQRRQRVAQQQQVDARASSTRPPPKIASSRTRDVVPLGREHERGDRARGGEHRGVADRDAPEQRGTARGGETRLPV